ncbi:retrovirus-related pol polyprotein from transposon TNT 1-94 [Tanacetum coccineum]
MIFKRPVPIPALLCSIGLITNHGHNESNYIVGERKMDCKFFSRLIKDHLSLEPQGMHSELPLREVSFLDQKGLVHMRISVTRRRNDTMQMSVPLILCFKDHPKISTSSSITTLKQNQFGTTSKCFSQLYDEFERFKMLPGENINEYYVRFHKLVNDMRNIRMTMPNIQLNSKFVNNMSPEWDRFVTAVKLNKGLKETNHEQLYAYLKQHEKHAAQDRLIIERITPATNDQLAFMSTNQRYFARGNGTTGNGGAQNRAGNANAGQGKPVKCYNCNGVGHIARNCTQPKRLQNSDYFKDKMLLMQAQENGAVLDEEELLFLAGEHGNTFDADVDNQSVQDLALNDDNIFQEDEFGSANPQAGPSNTSILSEVHILENAIDHSVSNQNEHEIHNKVQLSNVIDSTSVHMGNSNVIPYKQYLSVNTISVVPSCASSALNSVAIYEQRAKFELTELKSTMENNKIIKEIVTTLKQEFKQKESKFLTDFSNLKHLNDKLENKLHSQDQSIQTVHMMLNPTQMYDQKTKTALDVFYTATDSVLNVSRFSDLHDAFTSAQKRIADLESENFNLRNKIQHDDHDSMIKHFSKLEVEHFNLQLKYQNLKERFGNKKPVTSSDAPSFDSLFVIGKLNEQIQSRGNTIRELKEKISRLTKKNSDTDPTFDLKALVSQNKDLTTKAQCPSRSQ